MQVGIGSRRISSIKEPNAPPPSAPQPPTAMNSVVGRPITIACEWLESNPQRKWDTMVVASDLNPPSVYLTPSLGQYNPRECTFSDELHDPPKWRRLGAAVRNSTFQRLVIINHSTRDTEQQCIDAFWREAKHTKSIDNIHIDTNAGPMEHFAWLIQHSNASILMIGSRSAAMGMSLEQSAVLSTAIRTKQWKEIYHRKCYFQDGSYEQLVGSFARSDKLSLSCQSQSQFTALAGLLQDTTRIITHIDLWLEETVDLDHEQAARTITESVVGNTQLQRLNIYHVQSHVFSDKELSYSRAWNCFEKLLCDAASIERISNSNNTLVEFSYRICRLNHSLADFGYYHTPTIWEKRPFVRVRQCLDLNRNEDKAEVTRNKILQFYFVGEFDLSPFSNMAVSVLPEVLSRIEATDKLSALYRLLQGIPNLCNVNDRVYSEQGSNNRWKRYKRSGGRLFGNPYYRME